ncbi:hypothetical protein JOQ06_020932, partial [Pogonophryne albipinna]
MSHMLLHSASGPFAAGRNNQLQSRNTCEALQRLSTSAPKKRACATSVRKQDQLIHQCGHSQQKLFEAVLQTSSYEATDTLKPTEVKGRERGDGERRMGGGRWLHVGMQSRTDGERGVTKIEGAEGEGCVPPAGLLMDAGFLGTHTADARESGSQCSSLWWLGPAGQGTPRKLLLHPAPPHPLPLQCARSS